MKRILALGAAVAATTTGFAVAAPYASNVAVSGTNVTFTLNEAGSTLFYTINGGPQIALDGSTKGTKTFSLNSASDSFAITAVKNEASGYNVANGGSAPVVTNGQSQVTPTSGFNLVSSDSNVLGRFNSPRGIAISNNPNAVNFGTAYVSNSAAGTVAANATNVTAPARTTTGEGLYALRADVSDAFGQGNAALNGGIVFDTANAGSPFRNSVSSDGNVYVADFSDTKGTVYRLDPTLTTGTNQLNVIGGPSAVPATQNHGSTLGAVVVGSGANAVLYTLDEDLTFNQYDATSTNTGKNNLWRYDIGAATSGYSVAPTRVNQASVLLTGATTDLDVGLADGKFYLAQNRSAGAEAGITVLNPDGTLAYDSLTASRNLLGSTTAADILRNVLAMDVSDDQKSMAVMLNNSDVLYIPLVNGIPDLANRLVVDTGADVISGRDIAFDAVGNIHYVSSGQAIYRILSPGGSQGSTLSYSPGSGFSLVTGVPEPTSLAALGLAGALLRRRRR